MARQPPSAVPSASHARTNQNNQQAACSIRIYFLEQDIDGNALIAIFCEMSSAMRKAFFSHQMIMAVRNKKIRVLRFERKKAWLMMIRTLVPNCRIEIEHRQEPAFFKNPVRFGNNSINLIPIDQIEAKPEIDQIKTLVGIGQCGRRPDLQLDVCRTLLNKAIVAILDGLR